MTGTTTAAPAATRARVGWGDLLWLTWRQHRWTVGGTAVLVAAVAALCLGMAWHIDASGHMEHELLFGEFGYRNLSRLLGFLPMTTGFLVAVFWAAPLLSREYEQRTHLVVWTQDLSPVRWLAGKVVLLGVPAVALAAGFGAAVVTLMNSVNAVTTEFVPYTPFDTDAFEAVPHVQVGYAALGFAVGLALSAFTRRTVLSMGLALVGFGVVRVLVSGLWRPHFQEPLRAAEPISPNDGIWLSLRNRGDWIVDAGYLDAAGNEVRFVDIGCAGTGEGWFERCMAESGIVQNYYDYQPVDRVLSFQLFELGVFTALAAALVALAFWWVKRAHRV